jgi:hypothetical protein
LLQRRILRRVLLSAGLTMCKLHTDLNCSDLNKTK